MAPQTEHRITGFDSIFTDRLRQHTLNTWGVGDGEQRTLLRKCSRKVIRANSDSNQIGLFYITEDIAVGVNSLPLLHVI